jgi:hypothetical protein
METYQRHAEPAIPPWTQQWSYQRRLGFGIVSIIPLVMLMVALGCLTLATLGIARPASVEVLPLLFYMHIGAQFITLLVFGHLMIANPSLGDVTKLIWGIAFLFMAPFAIPTYWAAHVRREEPTLPSLSMAVPAQHEVHVYDYDYETHQEGTEVREDGAIVHHIDAFA